MRWIVKVKPGSSQEKVVESDGVLTVYLRAKPHGGEANEALVKVLAKHFSAPKTAVQIVRGAKSREKIVEI